MICPLFCSGTKLRCDSRKLSIGKLGVYSESVIADADIVDICAAEDCVSDDVAVNGINGVGHNICPFESGI